MAESGKGAVTLFTTLALLVWLGGFHFNVLVLLLVYAFFPSPYAMALFLAWMSLAFLPVNERSPFAVFVSKFICRHAPDYFPLRVKVEDSDSIDPNKAYVLGIEPHSILPIGILGIAEHSNTLPQKKLKLLASSAVFYVPIIRHVWSWLGLVPATKQVFKKFINQGFSVGLIPGGVQECLYMKHGEEVLFLKKRLGFVKIAIETGAPLIPCFCFGQTSTYNWWKPQGSWYGVVARKIGFAPLLFWGIFGSPIPFQSPMTFVVGKPIHCQKIENPTSEQILELHSQFLVAIEQLFEKHKADAGYNQLKLKII